MPIKSAVGGYFERSFDPKTIEETRTMDFIISTESKDRHGTRLNSKNWQLDNYALNPIVMYQHQGYGDNPCIKSVPDDIIAKSIVALDTFKGRDVLAAQPTFETKDINEQAEKIFRKLIFGSLRGASVGFIEVGKGTIEETKNARGEKEKTYVFEGQELLEWSVVHLPSNAQSGARHFIDHVMTEVISLERMLQFSKNELLNMKVCDVISELKKLGYSTGEIDRTIEETTGPQETPILNTKKDYIQKRKNEKVKTTP